MDADLQWWNMCEWVYEQSRYSTSSSWLCRGLADTSEGCFLLSLQDFWFRMNQSFLCAFIWPITMTYKTLQRSSSGQISIVNDKKKSDAKLTKSHLWKVSGSQLQYTAVLCAAHLLGSWDYCFLENWGLGLLWTVLVLTVDLVCWMHRSPPELHVVVMP